MAQEPRVDVPGTEPLAVPGAQAIAEVEPDAPLEVTVLVPARQSLDELQTRLSQGQQPVLSREEFAAAYGAEPAVLQHIAEYARTHGLEVVESSPGRRSIVLRGRAADVADAFGVRLMRYRGEDGATFRAADGPIRVPPDLADAVQGVFGLDDRPVAQRTDA